MFFTLWEIRRYYISFVACQAEALAKAGRGFTVCDYSFTLDALDLQHPRILQRVNTFRIYQREVEICQLNMGFLLIERNAFNAMDARWPARAGER
jgi:hypothetical protein